MPLEIRVGTEADINEMFDVRHKAWTGSPVLKLMFPQGESDEGLKYRRELTRGHFKPEKQSDSSKEMTWYRVVEDTATRNIVSVSRWTIRRTTQPPSEWNKPFTIPDYGSDADTAAMESFLGQMDAARKRHLRGDPCIVLERIETLPEYQGRGAASLLLAWGTALADADHLPLWLEATDAGHPLYYKFGFRDVDMIVVDLAALQVPGGGFQRNACMLRAPAAATASAGEAIKAEETLLAGEA